MAKVNELWQDILSGKIPLMYDSEHRFREGCSPVSVYRHYESDETGAFDLAIMAVQADFFADMEQEVARGLRRKYDCVGETLQEAADAAWSQVWNDQKSGAIHRAFTVDYESTVPPAYTKDGRAHCYLYIALA